MIVLDTNVISELARQVPDPGVLSWLDSLEVSELATTAISASGRSGRISARGGGAW